MSTPLFEVPADPLVAPPKLIDPKNYAGQKRVVARVREEILCLMDGIRRDREALNAEWNSNYKVWDCQHEDKLYNGDSDVFFGTARKALETRIAHMKRKLFPNDQNFIIKPNNPWAAMMAPQIGQLERHFIEQADVSSKIDLFLRLGLIYGCSVVKIRWKTMPCKNYRRVPIPMFADPTMASLRMPGEPISTFEEYETMLYEGPTFDVVDLLRWYIYPRTVDNLDDARIIFEDIDVDFTHLKAMQRAGKYMGVDKLKDPKRDQGKRHYDIDSNRDERMNTRNFDIRLPNSKNPEFRLTEIYAKFDLYGDDYEIPCKIVAVGDDIIEIRQNPFFAQRPPYRAWRVTEIKDDFYAQGQIHTVKDKQDALNAFANLGLDAAKMALCPVLAGDVTNLPMDPEEYRSAPHAFWPVYGEPDRALRVFTWPDLSPTSYQTVTLLMTQIEDETSSPPIVQGKGSRKEQTATQSVIQEQGATSFVDSDSFKVNKDVLTKMLRDNFFLAQQYLSANTYMMTTGGAKVPIPEEVLIADAGFEWMVADDAAQHMMLISNGQGMTAVPGGQQPPSPGPAAALTDNVGLPGAPGMPGMPNVA